MLYFHDTFAILPWTGGVWVPVDEVFNSGSLRLDQAMPIPKTKETIATNCDVEYDLTRHVP